MHHSKKIAIIGATSAMAGHCARLWLAQEPCTELILVGRDLSRLQRVVADLQVRSPQARIHAVQASFSNPIAIDQVVADMCASSRVDIALIAHGALPEQTQCQNDLQACHEALDINGISPVLYAEAFAKYMSQANHGTIALIGSVAGDRGRQSNYIYGAAKGMVTRYAQGLQHRFADSAVKVVLIKPGPTDTPMTAHLKGQGANLAPVEGVARDILAGIAAGTPVVYAPKKWWLIMMVIRHLPAFIFNKMKI